MSFRPPRYLAALSAVCAALLLQACAATGGGAGVPAASAPPAQGPLWQVVDGGLMGSNVVTGPVDVRFMEPVAVAARGHLVYIVDTGLQKLFAYDSRLDRIDIAMDLRGVIHGDGAAIFLDRDLGFFLADSGGGRVLRFDQSGKLLQVFEDRINLGRPVAVAVNQATGYIFIADGFNDHVLVFTPAGQLEAAIGGRGQGPGKFLGITALAESPRGFYIGSRFGADRVQVMGNDGLYLDSLQPDTVTFPTAIAVRSDGLAFVSDYLADDIKVFDGNNRLVATLGGHGSAPGRFRRITGLWLDEDSLYVADSLNRRIQILSLPSWELSQRAD
jgi:DNA-binding beta-propeller fold protein YncE